LERKLTAILCADVFGYSRLMGEDEEATLRTLSSYRKLIDSLIEQHHGRFVNSAGDSVLAEFASVVNAVQCAVEIQTTLKAENENMPPERRMEFRIGVNLGDVMMDGEQIYGDGVNVAARLESLAEPGGICVSHTVHDQIKNKLALNYEDLGPQTVKNIAEPVRVLRIMPEGGASTRTATEATERSLRKHWRGGVFSLAGLALIAAVIVFVQHLSLRPPTTTASIPSTHSPALTLPNIPSIAVLPFTNMSGDRDQEYFSDGITDDLTTALSRLPDLFVIARTSAFTYKGKAVKVQDISQQLGVKYVLEGSVRKADNQVRITAQLVDATTGDHIWAEHYDRALRDIFSLQDEIVRRIVTTLNLQLHLTEKGVRVVKRTDNLEAYDYYLRGVEGNQNPTKDGNEKARQMFQKAIELDPKYSDAYAGLGYVLFTVQVNQWSHDPHGFEQVIQLEQQSIVLDNSNAFAYALMSFSYTWTRQYDLAVSAAERGIALDPNSALGHFSMAIALSCSGKPAEALKAAQNAIRLDPGHRDVYSFSEGTAYMLLGSYEQAIPPLKMYLARFSNFIPAHLYLIACYVELGRSEDARAEAAEVMRINPQFSLAAQRQMSVFKEPARDRLYGDMAKAGLK
jgi:adenylate cyclase